MFTACKHPFTSHKRSPLNLVPHGVTSRKENFCVRYRFPNVRSAPRSAPDFPRRSRQIRPNVGGTENRTTVTRLVQVQCSLPPLNAPTDVDFSGESQASSSLYAVAKFFDCYDSIRENGSDFQPSAHRLDEVAQSADIHIGSALEFRNGSLVYPENCRQILLSQFSSSP